MITNKILGYILLTAGILLIICVMWQTYNIFTDKTSAPLVFKTAAVFADKTGSQDIQGQINDAVKKQIGQIISPDSAIKVLNLASWSLLAWILIVAGGTLSGIGVKLIK